MARAWDSARVASYYDEYGEREWTRFIDGRATTPSYEVHLDHLRRFVRSGDRVLDIGAGPGRFTIELARLGADIVVADISPVQLESNRRHVGEAGCEARVLERAVANVTDLSRWKDSSFDAAVCFGGPVSYVLDEADRAMAELMRVTRPGGHVLVSVMSLVGAAIRFLPDLMELARRDGAEKNLEILRSGLLLGELGYGHLAMKLYRWGDLEALLSRHGTVVGGAAAGLLPPAQPEEPELKEFLVSAERMLAEDPGARSAGEHIIGVVRKEP